MSNLAKHALKRLREIWGVRWRGVKAEAVARRQTGTFKPVTRRAPSIHGGHGEKLRATLKDVEASFPFFAALRALCVEVFDFTASYAKYAKKTFGGEHQRR